MIQKVSAAMGAAIMIGTYFIPSNGLDTGKYRIRSDKASKIPDTAKAMPKPARMYKRRVPCRSFLDVMRDTGATQ